MKRKAKTGEAIDAAIKFLDPEILEYHTHWLSTLSISGQRGYRSTYAHRKTVYR